MEGEETVLVLEPLSTAPVSRSSSSYLVPLHGGCGGARGGALQHDLARPPGVHAGRGHRLELDMLPVALDNLALCTEDSSGCG